MKEFWNTLLPAIIGCLMACSYTIPQHVQQLLTPLLQLQFCLKRAAR